MQKWDYMMIRSYGWVVMKVDEKEIGQMQGGQPIGEMLY